MWYNDGYFLISMANCKSKKKLNRMQNDLLAVTVFMRMFNTAMTRYKLKGLPETMSERLVLQSLIIYGNITFFIKNDNLLALPSVPSGNGYNINGDPTSAWVFARNGLLNEEIALYVPGGQIAPILENGTAGKTWKPQKGVMVWENKSRFPFLNEVIYYSQAVADTLRTVDVARKWLKNPFIAVAEESVITSVKKMLDDVEKNDEAVIVSTGVQDINRFNILPVTESTESIQAATELIDWYEQRFRALCGMRTNSNIDKKGENLISDEVHINDSYTDSITTELQEYLQSQFDFVNEVFGTSIKVEENKDFQSDGQMEQIKEDNYDDGNEEDA